MSPVMPLLNEGHAEISPSSERRTSLAATYRHNQEAGRAPYAAVSVQTIGELHWLMERRPWSGQAKACGQDHADLRLVSLAQANLNDAHLFESNLDDAEAQTVQWC